MSEERSRRERDKRVPARRDDRDEAERRRATRKEQDVLLDVSKRLS
jgi:hypothetical protein